MEQLQSTTVSSAGARTSKRTAPQWQPPRWVTSADTASKRLLLGRDRLQHQLEIPPVDGEFEMMEEARPQQAIDLRAPGQRVEHADVQVLDRRSTDAYGARPDQRD